MRSAAIPEQNRVRGGCQCQPHCKVSRHEAEAVKGVWWPLKGIQLPGTWTRGFCMPIAAANWQQIDLSQPKTLARKGDAESAETEKEARGLQSNMVGMVQACFQSLLSCDEYVPKFR